MLAALRNLPDFVVSDRAGTRFGVPLLMFHWLQPEELGRYLGWLSEAGYVTLSADEVAAVARGQQEPPPRAVALTFDDGVYNNWSVVAPLLRRHGMRGIAFVVPALVGDGPPRPTLDDLDTGRVGLEALLDDDAVGRYLRWPEVRSLAAEGVLEIQSHTYDHAAVFTSDRIIDFQHPDASGRPRYPWLWSATGADPGTPLWGAPVYPMAPRLVGRRYFDDPGLRAACMRFVEVRGGRGYLADVTWREELTRFAALERKGRAEDARFETDGETARARLDTLRRGREALEERLGWPVKHIALPWSRGLRETPQLIAQAGYESGYTCERPSGRLHRGNDPFDLARVEGYWLESLPGPGRVSLPDRCRRGLRRRLTSPS